MLTTEGAIAGVAVPHDGHVAIVPASVMFGLADGLSQQASRVPGGLGLEVQAMTADLAEATGIGGAGAAEGPDSSGAEGQSSMKGVIVAWVDPDGPSARLVQVADVIEAVGDHAIIGVEHWRARTLRLVDGETVSVTVRRGGERRRVDVTARPPSGPPAAVARPLGLTLRRVPGVGAMVVEVERGSSAARAGLAPGDLVTHIGAVAVPSPAQVREQFASAPTDRPVVLSFRRGDSHQVTALRRQW
jgi:S1-C subfamily serine protease